MLNLPAVEELIDSFKNSAESSKLNKRVNLNKVEPVTKVKLSDDSNIATDEDELKSLPFVKQSVEEELPFVKQTEENSFDLPITQKRLQNSDLINSCSTKIPVKHTTVFTPVTPKDPINFNLLKEIVQTPNQDTSPPSSPIRFSNEDFGVSEFKMSEDNPNQAQNYNDNGNDIYSPSKPTASPRKPTALPRKPTASPRKPTALPRKPTASPSKPTASNADNNVIVIGESDDDSDCCIISAEQTANLPLPRPGIDFGDSPSSSPTIISQNAKESKMIYDDKSSYFTSTPQRFRDIKERNINFSKSFVEDSEKLPFVNNNASATIHRESLSPVKEFLKSPNERLENINHSISRNISYDNRTSSSDESRMSNDPMFADNFAPMSLSPTASDRTRIDLRCEDRFRQHPNSARNHRHNMSPRSSCYDNGLFSNRSYGNFHHKQSRNMSPTYRRSRSPPRWDIDKRLRMNIHPLQSEFEHSKNRNSTRLSRSYKSPIRDSDYNSFNKRSLPRRHPTNGEYNRNNILRPAPSRTESFIGMPPNRMNVRPESRSHGQAPSRNDERPPLLPVPKRPYEHNRY